MGTNILLNFIVVANSLRLFQATLSRGEKRLQPNLFRRNQKVITCLITRKKTTFSYQLKDRLLKLVNKKKNLEI